MKNNLIEGRWYCSGAHIDAPIVKYIGMENETRAKFVRIGSDVEEEVHFGDLIEIAVLPRYFEELANLKENTDKGDIVYVKGRHFFGFEANNPSSECYVSEYIPVTSSSPKFLGKVRTISELQGLIDIHQLGSSSQILEVIKRR